MTRYSVSASKLERAEELCEEVMGRAWGENAAGVGWMGDVWGLLNQATGKIATAMAMLEDECGWEGLERDEPTSEQGAAATLKRLRHTLERIAAGEAEDAQVEAKVALNQLPVASLLRKPGGGLVGSSG